MGGGEFFSLLIVSYKRNPQLLANFLREQIIDVVMQRYDRPLARILVDKLSVTAFLSSGRVTMICSQVFQEFFFLHAFTVSLL